jgi:hypothetical protein
MMKAIVPVALLALTISAVAAADAGRQVEFRTLSRQVRELYTRSFATERIDVDVETGRAVDRDARTAAWLECNDCPVFPGDSSCTHCHVFGVAFTVECQQAEGDEETCSISFDDR